MTPVPKETSAKDDVFIFSNAVFRAVDCKFNFSFLMKLNGIIVGASTSQGPKVFSLKEAKTWAIYLTLLEVKAVGLSKSLCFLKF